VSGLPAAYKPNTAYTSKFQTSLFIRTVLLNVMEPILLPQRSSCDQIRCIQEKGTNMSSMLSITSAISLNNGVTIPQFGFGTWQLAQGRRGIDALLTALETGYRHIDTARAYDNEKLVGDAVRKSDIDRKNIFITSKLWNDEHGANEARHACEQSLEALGIDYIDLYLIHWPDGGKIPETWESLVELQNEGVCRAIGVSNFGIDDLQGLISAGGIKPAINQIEMNIFTYPRELIDFCRQNGIAVEAYSPLARGRGLRDAIINEIAQEYDKEANQIMLRWILQHEAIAIPKSSTPEHIISNADIFNFELSDQHMTRLDGISR
jgi:diketogulonate reductase-like aldo/keto reductase